MWAAPIGESVLAPMFQVRKLHRRQNDPYGLGLVRTRCAPGRGGRRGHEGPDGCDGEARHRPIFQPAMTPAHTPSTPNGTT